jgi:hypothetical protein
VEEVTIIDLHRAMQSRATTVYDPVYRLVPDGKRYVSRATAEPTTIPEPGLRFSLVFTVEPGREDALLRRMRRHEDRDRRGRDPVRRLALAC